jgi:hypothetical protein
MSSSPIKTLAKHVRLKVDRKTGNTFLLYPERGLCLNATASRILELCGLGYAIDQTVLLLAQETETPVATVNSDVEDFFTALSNLGLLESSHP